MRYQYNECTLALVATSFFVSRTFPADFLTSSLRFVEFFPDRNIVFNPSFLQPYIISHFWAISAKRHFFLFLLVCIHLDAVHIINKIQIRNVCVNLETDAQFRTKWRCALRKRVKGAYVCSVTLASAQQCAQIER